MRLAKCLCYLLLATAAVGADKDPKDSGHRTFRLEWRDLDRMIRGRNIDITLPAGIKLKGRVTSVEDDALMLDVGKTSNKRAYPKGRAVVPRPEVKRNSRWPGRKATCGARLAQPSAVRSAPGRPLVWPR